MLKILQVKLQQYVNQELLDVQVELRRQRNKRSNCQHLLDHRENKGISEKKPSTSASLTTLKPLIVGITTNCGKLLKTWEDQTTLSAS